MAEKTEIKITAGQTLANQDGLSNIGENQAEIKALERANVDGTNIFPTEVNAKRMSVVDGSFQGLLYAGTILVGTGGVTITSDPTGVAPTGTGISISSSLISLIKDGVPVVQLNGATGAASFTGAITATSGSFVDSITVGASSLGGMKTATGAAQSRADTGVANAATAQSLAASKMGAGNGVALNASKQMESITLNAGGISVATAASGARLLMNSAGLALYNSGGVNTVLLSNTGAFTLQSAASGARLAITATSIAAYNSSGVLTVYIDNSGTFTLRSATSGAYINITNAAITAYNSGGVNTVAINSDGSAVFTSVTVRSSSSTTRTQITVDGIAIYKSNVLKVALNHTDGLMIRNSTASPGLTERLSFQNAAGTEVGYLYSTSTGNTLMANAVSGFRLDSGGAVEIYGTQVYFNASVIGIVDLGCSKIKIGGTYELTVSGADLYWNGTKLN